MVVRNRMPESNFNDKPSEILPKNFSKRLPKPKSTGM